MTSAAAPVIRAAVGPIAVLADGLTVAAGSSKLLRRASIYIGLLMVALAGPGVVAALSILGWATINPGTSPDEETAVAAGRAAIQVLTALVGALIVVVEGSAIGIMLVAGRVLDRPIGLREAIQRSRRVFWRLVRVGCLVGSVQLAVSHLWHVVIGQSRIDDIERLTIEPIAAAIGTLPLLYGTVAIVLAGDGARAALRRSVGIARRARRLTIALGAFGLLSGVVQTLALGSALDLIIRLVEPLHLDLTAGGPSFLLAAALALAVIMAAGSLLFTVAAIVSAPQIVAWVRLGLPTHGLPEAAPEPVAGGAALEEGPTAVPEPPESTGWAPAPARSAWAAGAAAQAPFRWVTIPMRLVAAGIWLIAIASLIAGPPG